MKYGRILSIGLVVTVAFAWSAAAATTKPAELACEPLPHSSVLVSRPFAAASVEAAATYPDVR